MNARSKKRIRLRCVSRRRAIRFETLEQRELLTASANELAAERYIDVVEEFVGNVLADGRDKYGPIETPLLADGINRETRQPLTWTKNGNQFILSNLASQQTLLRTLVGVSSLTGNPAYRQAAVDAVAYGFDTLQSPFNGLLAWGGHTAYDLGNDIRIGSFSNGRHELKRHFPFYELMWEVDPNATYRFIEGFWGAHVIDWSKLDFDRHGSFQKQVDDVWN
ncbi:MAG: pectate lyase [Pirellulaceae bacterium]|jgi:pectate lyase